MSTVAFGQPWALLLLLLPLLAGLRRVRSVPVLSVPWSAAAEWAPRRSRWVWRGGRTATLLGWAGLALAATSPVVERPAELPPEASVAVMVVLDVSASMTGGDAPALPNARAALEELVAEQEGFRLGLVTFAGSALTRLPPTRDLALVEAALATADAGLSDQGTALGTAIGLAGQRLQATEAHGRAVILLTDGMSNTGAVDPETAASLARSDGIPVHAVLLGDTPDDGARSLRGVVAAGGGRLIPAAAGAMAVRDALAELIPPTGLPGPPERTPLWGGLLMAAGVLLVLGEAARAWKPTVAAPWGELA